MTDYELQVAIDKTATLARESAAGAVREMSFKHLQELMKIQVVRAGLPTQVSVVKPGSIVRCKDNRIGCEKILGGLCDCGGTA